MKITVINRDISVNAVKVVSISGSSVFLVGDTQSIHCSSAFDSVIEYTQSAPDQVKKRQLTYAHLTHTRCLYQQSV